MRRWCPAPGLGGTCHGRHRRPGRWYTERRRRQHQLPSVEAMKTLLIVFHSLTGGARQMAEAAAEGASAEPDVTVSLLAAPDAGAADVLDADAYIFATPENLAAMAGRMKDF